MEVVKTRKIGITIIVLFVFLLVNLHAQEEISLQGFAFENNSQNYNGIVQQYEFQKTIIERQFSNPSFDYVHFSVSGFNPKEGDGDIIRFFTTIYLRDGKDLVITISRYLNGWYCELILVFTNKSGIGAFLDGYACKNKEDADKFRKSYHNKLKQYIGIDFDSSGKLIFIRPESYGGTFG
jgi:hypothetical protein